MAMGRHKRVSDKMSVVPPSPSRTRPFHLRILSVAVQFDLQRSYDAGRSLAPLEKTRGFGMTRLERNQSKPAKQATIYT
jgi:hypothetical protein